METDRSEARRRAVYALLAIAFYAAHAVHLARIGRAPEALWSCHLACVLLAAGVLLRLPVLSAIALMWLVLGLPLWVWSILSDTDFHLTSTLTHVGGLVLAFSSVFRWGFPRDSWWSASGGVAAVWLLSRILLPPDWNVNLSSTFWFGWEEELVSYPMFLLFMLIMAASVFRVTELLVRAALANRLKRT